MAVRPVEDGLARAGVWWGAALLLLSRFVETRAETVIFLAGLGFVVLGMLTLPKHPEHYQDFSEAKPAEKPE